MKKIYVAPDIQTIKFDLADIITNSNATSGNNSGAIVGPGTPGGPGGPGGIPPMSKNGEMP